MSRRARPARRSAATRLRAAVVLASLAVAAIVAAAATAVAEEGGSSGGRRRGRRRQRRRQGEETTTTTRRELASSSPYFNMRLHWQPGYRWQDSSRERHWCMKCRSNLCSRGSGIKIDRCDRSDQRQHFFFDSGRVRSRKNKSVCLTRRGRSIRFDSCGSSNPDQVWSTLTKDGPFELSPPGNDAKCASQHHHPREDEKVYMTSCKLSRESQTDKWIVY